MARAASTQSAHGQTAPEADGPPLWAVGLLTALVLAGLLSAPAAGARDGDFVHLWLGGHALWEAGPAALYDPGVHRALLEAAYDGTPPAELWASRNDLFGAFFYPPPTGLAYAPLGALPVRLAGTLHAGVAWLGVGLAGLLLGRWTGLGRVFGLLVVFTTPAVFHNHVLGQNGGWVLLVCAAAGAWLVRGRDVAAGLLLGLLVCKPNWLVAAGCVPLVVGRWRAVGATVGSAVAVSVGAAVVVGPAQWQAWLELAPSLAALSHAPDYPLHLQYSLWGLGRRVAGLGTAGDLLGGGLALGLALATAAVVTRRSGALVPRLALGFCAASLVNPHLHPYDVTGGIFAVAVLLARPATRRLGALILVVHHGGQALEGLSGSGWAVAPGTVGLLAAWAALAWALGRGSFGSDPSSG